MLKETDEA